MGATAIEEIDEDFNADTFADYWDSIQTDVEFGVEFMSVKVLDDEGRDLLAMTASILAQRHGVSSDKIKTYRMSMRKACEKAGIDTIWSPKKTKGTGTTSNPTLSMTLVPVTAHVKVAKDGEQIVFDRLTKGLKKGEYSMVDINNAVYEISKLY